MIDVAARTPRYDLDLTTAVYHGQILSYSLCNYTIMGGYWIVNLSLV